MLTGRVECPCGHRATVVGSRGKKAYQCFKGFKEKQGRFLQGISLCQPATYSLPRTERSVLHSLQNAAEHPEVFQAAAQAYGENEAGQKTPAASVAALRRERTALAAALAQIAQDEAATVQGQIAGIRAGASPDAYAAVFADLAAQRKDLESRRGTIARKMNAGQEKTPAKKSAHQNSSELAQQALSDMARILSSDTVPGRDKRDLMGKLIKRVVCQPDGADIYYLPGVLPFASSIKSSTLTELMQ